jgi:hypothetical protein
MVFMARSLAVAVGLCLTVLAGCDTGRLNDLEKQNQELKAEVEKQHTTQDYELQARCAKDARAWFNGNWSDTSRNKDTNLLHFTNHYNAKLNKCFIMVEWHYKSIYGDPGAGSWTNDMNLYDVYQNAQYAQFGENHNTYYKPQIHVQDDVIACEVQGEKCKTIDKFNNLMRPYMND